MNFEEIKQSWNWAPIRNCPGRFILRRPELNITPQDIVGSSAELREFHVDKAKDAVIIVKFIDGGLISYAKSDGTFLHTLNTIDGFRRKLDQLGINL